MKTINEYGMVLLLHKLLQCFLFLCIAIAVLLFSIFGDDFWRMIALPIGICLCILLFVLPEKKKKRK